jgi:transposase
LIVSDALIESNAKAPVFVGIDVSRLKLDLAQTHDPRPQSFANDPAGIGQLVGLMRQLAPTLIVVESTGKLEHDLLAGLLEAQLPVAHVNPRRVRQFALALGKWAKSDPIDAAVLAEFGQRIGPRLLEQRPKNRGQLTEMLACRRQLIESRTAHQNQLYQAHMPFVQKSLGKVLSLLNRQVEQLDRQIARVIDDDEHLDRMDQILRSIPGVGAVLSATLLAQLSELGQLGHKQIAALAGVAPMDRQSGPRDLPRHIRGGRQTVRNVLYMGGLTAIRVNPTLKSFYQRLRDRGKSAKQALVAVMHKLLRICNAMLRDNRPWSPRLMPIGGGAK